MIKPLFKPLEEIPTIMRVCRYLELEFTNQQYSKISKLILNAYGKQPEKVIQKEGYGYFKVCIYPENFIPTMIQIIKDYHISSIQPKPEKKRRPRINQTLNSS